MRNKLRVVGRKSRTKYVGSLDCTRRANFAKVVAGLGYLVAGSPRQLPGRRKLGEGEGERGGDGLTVAPVCLSRVGQRRQPVSGRGSSWLSLCSPSTARGTSPLPVTTGSWAEAPHNQHLPPTLGSASFSIWMHLHSAELAVSLRCELQATRAQSFVKSRDYTRINFKPSASW